jgi:hypothetical protein
MMNKGAISLLLILGLAVSCSFLSLGAAPFTGRQAGAVIPTISNPKQPRPVPGRPCRPVFSEEIVIGGGDDPDMSPADLVGAAVAEDGTAFLLDMTECRVLAYAASGQFLRSFGRRGQGPGEFSWPMIIRLSPAGEVLVEDFSGRKVSVFSPDGRFQRAISTALGSGFTNLTIHPKSGYVAQQRSGDSSDIAYHLRKFGPVFEPGPILESRPGLDPLTKKFRLGALFWYVIDARGRIFVVDEEAYAVRVYSPEGRLERRITRDFEPIRSTPEERKSPEGLPRGVTLPAVETPKYEAAIRNCLLDESGRLFINVREKNLRQGTSIVDVFDPEGRYIARMELPGRPVVWKNGRVYLISENEDGLGVLRSRRVDWR